MENLIEVRGLFKTYPGFRLENLDLTVPAGTIVGLIGENGAGKTTTIQAIFNVVCPDRGTVKLLGGDPADPSVRQKAAVVFAESCFYGGMRTNQISRVMAGICPGWDGVRFAELCQKFGLTTNKLVKDYSRGMRMKLELAAALARKPRLLVLDEPTSGLDPVVRESFLDLLLDFQQDEGHAVLFSTHITTDLERVADQIAYIYKGRLLFQMDKDELLEGMAVLRCAKNDMERLPAELVQVYRNEAMGVSALVREPERVRHLLPHAVVERLTLDELMRLYGGRNEQ